jgi:hypothetical protein
MDAGPDGPTGSPAGGSAAASPPPSGPWFLLPLTWCVWLLVWLIPSFLVAPHLAYLRPWLSADTAPAAVCAAASLFLVAIWPFWPALAAGGRRSPASILLRSAAEILMLVALAAPFAVVAWAVGSRAWLFDSLGAAVAVPAALGLGFRLVAEGLGPRATRWLIAAALLIAAGPVLAAYAASETLGGGLLWLLDVSPVVACINMATSWWPWPTASYLVQVFLWPAVGLLLAVAGVWARSRQLKPRA